MNKGRNSEIVKKLHDFTSVASTLVWHCQSWSHEAQNHSNTAGSVTEGLEELLYSNLESATLLIMEERDTSEIFPYSDQVINLTGEVWYLLSYQQ